MYHLAIAGCCLLAAGLRLYSLADANPWWDEGFTYWLASQDVPGMLLRTAGDTHPPLSYFLYQPWMPLAGRTIYALRFQAVLFGVLATPVCAAAARRLGGRKAGAVAGLLVAISPFHIWWSQQIRMYSLVALLCALSIFFLLRAARDGEGYWSLAVVNLAALYTLYFFAVLVLLEGLIVAWFLLGLHRARMLRTAAALAVGPALLLPWLAFYRLHAIRFAAPATPPLSWRNFVEASWGELMLGIDTGVERYALPLLVLGLAAVVVVASLLRTRAARTFGVWLALVAVGLPLAAYGITLQRGLFFSPEYQTRYDLPALPALLILLAWAVGRLPRPASVAAAALFAGAAASSLPAMYYARHRTDDYQSLARFVEAYGRPGDAIVFDPDKNFHLFLLDYRGPLPSEAIPEGQHVDAAYAAQLLSRWAAQHRALWLLQEAGGHDAGAQHPVRDWLEAHLQPALRLTIGDRLLVLYQPAGAATRGLNPAFVVGRRTGAVSFDQPLDDVRPGDVLHLAVYRQPVSALEFAGRTWRPVAFPGMWDFAIPIAAGTPAGDQSISVRLADGRMQPLSSVHVEAGPARPPVELPPLSHSVNRSFGGRALLTSYELNQDGQELTVKLQWRALAAFNQNYTVFVHLLDGASHVVVQRDAQPRDGQLPTVGWQPGQTLDDPYVLPLPAGLAPGTYRVEVGLYLQSTGERLPLDGSADEDHLILATVQIP